MDSLPDPIGDLLDLASIAKTPETRSQLAQTLGNLEQYSLSAISAVAERAVAAFVPR